MHSGRLWQTVLGTERSNPDEVVFAGRSDFSWLPTARRIFDASFSS